MNIKQYVVRALAAVSILFSACSIYTDISVKSPPETDLYKYRTFAWLPDNTDTANTPYNNEVIRNNLRNYFGRSFAERGYKLDLDTPDILLQLVIENKQQELTVVHPPWPRSYYFSRYYYKSNYFSPYPYNYYYNHYAVYCYPSGYCEEKIGYVEGTITLNMIDRKQNKLVWSATAKGDIYDPSLINMDIHPAVRRIMKKYPVKPLDYRRKNFQTGKKDESLSFQ